MLGRQGLMIALLAMAPLVLSAPRASADDTASGKAAAQPGAADPCPPGQVECRIATSSRHAMKIASVRMMHMHKKKR